MAYASNTHVSEDRSRAEIEKLLIRYGASRFGYFREERRAVVGFTYQNLNIQMEIPLPDQSSDKFTKTPTGRKKTGDKMVLYEAEVKRRWRSLALAIKAKLISIEDGVTNFEREFLSYVITSNGQTIGDRMMPMIEEAKSNSGVLALPFTSGGR